MTTNQYDIIEQFRKAMYANMVPYDGKIIADSGKIERFSVTGDGKKKTGWYILHTKGVAAGSFGCWKRNVSETWCSKSSETMTDDERRAFAKRCAEDRQRRADDLALAQAEAADMAAMIWGAADDCTDHPYLTRKRVSSHGLKSGRFTRVNDDGEIWFDYKNALFVPIYDGKKLASLQVIFAEKQSKLYDRDKDFIAGGKQKGCFFVIGNDDESENIVFCEGYATAATIYESTGFCVVVCFTASNLKTVAARFREKHPLKTFIIGADNDQFTMVNGVLKNVGLLAAKDAADTCKAWLAVPQFADLSSKPTDFNDLFCLEGVDAVKSQIIAAINPSPVYDITPDDAEPETAVQLTPISVDYITPLPIANDKGKPKNTIENLYQILRRLGVTVRYNVIKKDIEIIIPNDGFSLDNEANASLAWLMSQCARFDFPTDKIGDFLCYIADKHQYNPVANWINSVPWDGVSRINQLLNTITIEDEEDIRKLHLRDSMVKKWMLCAVAAAFNPKGVSSHGVLVFQGDQYVGKTKWFKTLVPSELGVIQDGLSLRPDDRDSVKIALSYWMVELGELDATFRKSDIAALKAFITRDQDTFRRAYARLESTFARRTVFFASVNPDKFLHDPTGNRRYWTISCKHLDHSHTINMQQVWAEIYETMYKTGESWYLDKFEMDLLNTHNNDFEINDPIEERIKSRLDWEENQRFWREISATDLLSEIGFDRPAHGDPVKCGQIIKKITGLKSKKTKRGNMLLVPPLIRKSDF